MQKNLQNLRIYKDMLSIEDIEEIDRLKDTFIDILPQKSSLNIIKEMYQYVLSMAKISF